MKNATAAGLNTSVHSTKPWNRRSNSNVLFKWKARLVPLIVILAIASIWVYLGINGSPYSSVNKAPYHVYNYSKAEKVKPREVVHINDKPIHVIREAEEVKERNELPVPQAKTLTTPEELKERKQSQHDKSIKTEQIEDRKQPPKKISSFVNEHKETKERPNEKVKQPKENSTIAKQQQEPSSNDMAYDPKLDQILRKAAMAHRTVIVTALNKAWAEPGSVFDILLESFRVGNQTSKLLKHLVVVTLDPKAYARCLTLHPLKIHCYRLDSGNDNFSSEVHFMTSEYLRLVWKKIEVLGNILSLGYNFLFTDADIVWFRNPMKMLKKDVDIQMSCDFFTGNETDLRMNFPNSGFQFVRSNPRTIQFYKFWHASREHYPGLKSQDVLNELKNQPNFHQRKLSFRFLDTAYIDGFCSGKLEFERICTMHANCCIGLVNKVHDLNILLQYWKKYSSLSSEEKATSKLVWPSAPRCRKSPEIEEAERNLRISKGLSA